MTLTCDIQTNQTPHNSVQSNVLVSPLSFQCTCILSEVVIWPNYERGWHCSAPYSSLVSKNGSVCRLQLILFPCDIKFFWLFVQALFSSLLLDCTRLSIVLWNSVFRMVYMLHVTCIHDILCVLCVYYCMFMYRTDMCTRGVSPLWHTRTMRHACTYTHRTGDRGGRVLPSAHLKITRVFICRLILNDIWFFLYDI